MRFHYVFLNYFYTILQYAKISVSQCVFTSSSGNSTSGWGLGGINISGTCIGVTGVVGTEVGKEPKIRGPDLEISLSSLCKKSNSRSAALYK